MKRKTSGRILSWVLTIAMLCGLAAPSAFAAQSGTGWSLDDSGALTVSSQEGMTDYGRYVWEIASSVTSVSLADGITSIPSAAFKGSRITEIGIPESVSEIQGFAFGYCTSMEEITIPSKVTALREELFRGCAKLRDVSFAGDILQSIGAQAFESCIALESLTFPEGVASVGPNAFSNCANLKSITFMGAEAPKTFDITAIQNTSEDLKIYVPKDSVDAYKAAVGESYADRVTADKGQNQGETDLSWYDKESTVFTLTTAAQLKGLAAIVNGTAEGVEKDDFAGKTVTLGGDIALAKDGLYDEIADVTYGKSDYPLKTTQYVLREEAPVWTPIGSGTASGNTALSVSEPFAGTFDGAGFTVSGVYTGTKDRSAGNTDTVQGLFGVVSGTVKNVTVSGCITGKFVIGGIAAYLAEGGSIENCVNNAVVFADGGTTPGGGTENGVSRTGAIGGIAGNAMTGTSVAGCINNGDVICANTAKGGRAGGIIGLIDGKGNAVSILNNGNNGQVEAYQYAGGIVGMNYSGAAPLSSCFNTGRITGHSSGSCYVGGIAAWSASDITDCYNTGDFGIRIDGSGSKTSHGGGIVSDLMTPAVIRNCYNIGSFFGYVQGNPASSASSYGMICGSGYGNSENNKLSNCYTLSAAGMDWPGEDVDNGCVTVENESAMKSADFVVLLNGGGERFTADKADNPVNRGYPVLRYFAGGDNVPEEPKANVTWYRAEETSFILTSADELAGLAAIVNGTAKDIAQDDFSGKTIILGEDIDLSGSADWMPIGTIHVSGQTSYTLGAPFAGVFDGQGHEISNLSVNDEMGGAALFGYSTGILKDFTVSGAVSGGSCMAGVAAAGSGSISGVTNRVTVHADGNYAGGIVGEVTGDISITDCHNKAEITNGGGIGQKSTGRIAGIAGRVESGIAASIINCSNTGNITGYQYVAGILGGSFGDVTVQGCFNEGALTAVSFGKTYVGGIVGQLSCGTVSSCYNTGGIFVRPWAGGHIRAVGGIVGCEAGHTEGVAVSDCYNAGVITMDTSKMISGSDYIYMSGNISGGNHTTGTNSMKYEDCFYLAGSMPIQESNHEGYRFWSDVFKENPLAYDTADIKACTSEELKGETVLAALGSRFRASEGSYPVLYWQIGDDTPDVERYSVSTYVSGGTAAVETVESAREGSEVSLAVSQIAQGKQLKRVRVSDASGKLIEVRESNGVYRFTMPGRAVSVFVVLENIVEDGAASYAVKLPESLDGIWHIGVDSTYYAEGRAKAGATVTIVVEKQPDAVTTSFDGVFVKTKEGVNVAAEADNVKAASGANYYGEYTFTMPESDITVELNEVYSELSIYEQRGSSRICKDSLTREEMISLSKKYSPVRFSGWSTETEPFIGISERYVPLQELLLRSGLRFEAGDRLVIECADGLSKEFSYEELMGVSRYYYEDILINGAAAVKRSEFAPILTITANTAFHAEQLQTLVCDTLNTYRFVFGQTEAELSGSDKAVDNMPKSVVSLTVVKKEDSSGGSGGSGGGSGGSGTTTADQAKDRIIVNTDEKGTVSVTPEKVKTGDTITITVKPADGYLIDGVKATDEKKNAVTVKDNGDGTYTFTLPEGKVTVDVTYKTDPSAQNPATGRFIDVADSAWYHDAVYYAADNGYFKGTSDTLFSPDVTMTRAMFATVIGRLAGIDESKYSGSAFSDVPEGQWYSTYIKWASENGVVNGVGGGKFDPDAKITREQMAAMMYRYAKFAGVDLTSAAADATAFNAFADRDSVSAYAKDAMIWATAKGIINGNGTGLAPKSDATRAQVAQIITNYAKQVAK